MRILHIFQHKLAFLTAILIFLVFLLPIQLGLVTSVICLPTEWHHPRVRTLVEWDGVVGFKQFCTTFPCISAAHLVFIRSTYFLKRPQETDMPSSGVCISVWRTFVWMMRRCLTASVLRRLAPWQRRCHWLPHNRLCCLDCGQWFRLPQRHLLSLLQIAECILLCISLWSWW